MTREDLEEALIKTRFRDYSKEIDDAFHELLDKKIEEQIIAQTLYDEYTETLLHCCVDAAQTGEEEDRAIAGELTNWKAVWNYLCGVYDYVNMLHGLDDREILSLYREHWWTKNAIESRSKEEVGNAADLFEFFNEPDAEADYSFWLKVSAWTAEEAVALSLGKDPSKVNSQSLFVESKNEKPSPFREEYRRRSFLVERAILAGELSNICRRHQHIEWFLNNELSLPAHIAQVEEAAIPGYRRSRNLEFGRTRPVPLTDTIQTVDPVFEMRRTTLCKVVLGMAMCAYGHRIGSGTNSTSTAIERDLELLRDQAKGQLEKLSVSDDKIRELLNKAASYLDVSWSENCDLSVFEAWRARNRGSQLGNRNS